MIYNYITIQIEKIYCTNIYTNSSFRKKVMHRYPRHDVPKRLSLWEEWRSSVIIGAERRPRVCVNPSGTQCLAAVAEPNSFFRVTIVSTSPNIRLGIYSRRMNYDALAECRFRDTSFYVITSNIFIIFALESFKRESGENNLSENFMSLHQADRNVFYWQEKKIDKKIVGNNKCASTFSCDSDEPASTSTNVSNSVICRALSAHVGTRGRLVPSCAWERSVARSMRRRSRRVSRESMQGKRKEPPVRKREGACAAAGDGGVCGGGGGGRS